MNTEFFILKSNDEKIAPSKVMTADEIAAFLGTFEPKFHDRAMMVNPAWRLTERGIRFLDKYAIERDGNQYLSESDYAGLMNDEDLR